MTRSPSGGVDDSTGRPRDRHRLREAHFRLVERSRFLVEQANALMDLVEQHARQMIAATRKARERMRP